MNIRKALPFLLGLPIALIATGVLAYQYRIQLTNRLQLLSVLPNASLLGKSNSVLIFAPHCDDESIATGGLIQTATRAGCNVKVVFLTNGDAFGIAARREFRDITIKPRDYVLFAAFRQRDTRRAAAALGLSEGDLIFLGYPDRGLSPMWMSHWEPDNPYRSPYTKTTKSPYPNSYRPRAIYCGRSLYEDIRSVLEEYQPDDVYIPHPSDDHSDHYATYAFVSAALSQLEASDPKILPNTRVHTYLVHRGDWPEPAGWKPKMALRPPAALARLDTQWDTFPLTEDIVTRKRQAILAHKTQTAIVGKFLVSFARKNEFFGRLETPTVAVVPDRAISIDGEINDWQGIDPGVSDAVADTVFRRLEKSGDVKRIYLAADSADVYIRVDFTHNLSKRIHYHVAIRSFGSSGKDDTRIWSARVDPPNDCHPPKTYFAWKGRVLEMKVPRSALGDASKLFISVDTALMRLRVDKTGWREFDLGT